MYLQAEQSADLIQRISFVAHIQSPLDKPDRNLPNLGQIRRRSNFSDLPNTLAAWTFAIVTWW